MDQTQPSELALTTRTRMISMFEFALSVLIVNGIVRFMKAINKVLVLFVHNVFCHLIGIYELIRLCSVYSVCRHSRRLFKTSVWHAFHILTSCLDFSIDCIVPSVVCLCVFLCLV